MRLEGVRENSLKRCFHTGNAACQLASLSLLRMRLEGVREASLSLLRVRLTHPINHPTQNIISMLDNAGSLYKHFFYVWKTW